VDVEQEAEQQVKTIELLREGESTRDGRMLTPGTVIWREQIPLLALPNIDQKGHEGGHIVGAVANIRREGHLIVGDPSIDLGDMILTCDVDQIGDPIEHDEGIEVNGGRLTAAYLNAKHYYPWDLS
jgi:hypothetical protein